MSNSAQYIIIDDVHPIVAGDTESSSPVIMITGEDLKRKGEDATVVATLHSPQVVMNTISVVLMWVLSKEAIERVLEFIKDTIVDEASRAVVCALEEVIMEEIMEASDDKDRVKVLTSAMDKATRDRAVRDNILGGDM